MVIPDVGPYRTLSGVPFHELSPGYAFAYTQRGNESRETRVRQIAASHLPQFLADMLGTSRVANPGGAARRHDILLRGLPDTIGWQLWCTDVEFVQGLMPGTTGRHVSAATGGRSIPVGGPRYNELILACHYQPLPYDLADDADIARFRVPELQRFVTREIDYAVESLPVPGGGFRWQRVISPNPGVPEKLFEPPPKIMNTGSVNYTWHNVPEPPADAINTLRGRINDRAFDDEPGWYPLPLRNHAPETLLFNGAKLETVRDLQGNYRFNVHYTFLKRDNGLAQDGFTVAGWNHLYRSASQAFERVVDDATQRYGIYRTGDFTALFRPVVRPMAR